MTKKITKREIETAYHEAGHAVVIWKLFGLPRIKKISIIKNKDYLGMVKTNKPKNYNPDIDTSPSTEIKIHYRIMESYAGVIAGKKATGKANHIGANEDYGHIADSILRVDGGFDNKLQRYLDKYLYRRTELLINQYWAEINAVAKELLKRKELKRNEFYNIVEKIFQIKLKKSKK